MTVTVALFRADLPEFKNVSFYPDSAINFWINISSQMLNKGRWGDPAPVTTPATPNTLYDLGQEYFIAHHLVMEKRAQDDSFNQLPPGMTVGVVNNTGVDKVNVGYDVAAGIHEGEAHWNTSQYGVRFISMVKLLGAGPVQVGGGGNAPYLSSAYAYIGPPIYPGLPQ